MKDNLPKGSYTSPRKGDKVPVPKMTNKPRYTISEWIRDYFKSRGWL